MMFVIAHYFVGCPRGVMVQAIDWQDHSKQVHTPVALLRSLLSNTLGKGMNAPYPPSHGLNSTTTVLLGEWLWY